jgi:hypothetical protein
MPNRGSRPRAWFVKAAVDVAYVTTAQDGWNRTTLDPLCCVKLIDDCEMGAVNIFRMHLGCTGGWPVLTAVRTYHSPRIASRKVDLCKVPDTEAVHVKVLFRTKLC